MKVTYLIGNGFDVNLGLPTKYSDYYQEYLEGIKNLDDSNPDNKMIKEFWDKIKDQIFDKWQDFEMACAEYLDGDERNVKAVLLDFTNKFSKYLLDLSSSYECSDEVADAFVDFVKNGYRSLTQRDLKQVSQYQVGLPINFDIRFINFNYTDSIEKVLNNYKNRHDSLIIDKINNANLQCFSKLNNSILHLHGSLKAHDLVIIGVDSTEQLKSSTLKDNPNLEKYCVKSSINQISGFGEREEQYISLVNSSDIIYTYGISFGETDKYRWTILKKWLSENDKHKLVVYEYNSKIHDHESYYIIELLNYIDDKKREVMKLIGIEESDYDKYLDQVFVIDSGDVLKCKFTKKEEVTT